MDFFFFFFLAAVSTRAWESNYTLHTVRIKTVGYRTSTNRIVIRVKLSIDRTVRRVAVFSTSRFISVGLHTLDQQFIFEVYSHDGYCFQHVQVRIGTSYNNDQLSMFEVAE